MYKFLEVEDFVPIDIEYVKKQRDKTFNIPNTAWDSIKVDLLNINEESLPATLRLYLLNHLPYCIIAILLDKQSV